MNEESVTIATETGEYKPPRFLDLVISIGAGALQVLVFEAGGKVAAGSAGGMEFRRTEEDEEGEVRSGGAPGEEGPNLELARYSIDMLELLKVKTKGNLEKDEEKFLDETIHQLRMKYVEVAQKPGEEAK